MGPRVILIFFFILLWSCGDQPSAIKTLDQAGEQFVKLGLELGEYDTNYVGSYIGPTEWREAAKENRRSTDELAEAIAGLLDDLEKIVPSEGDDVIRHKLLLGKARAMDTRIRMVNGETFSFAEEARLLFDVEVPNYDFAEFDRVLKQIGELIPGEGDLAERVDAFRSSVSIPAEKFSTVFDRALEECKRRTLEHLSLPATERFQLEYVTGEAWGGYLEYLGDNESLMRINVDFPRTTKEAIRFACHEGYPGHHVYNLLVDQRLLDRGWDEFLLFPLYAPITLIHEASAEFGVKLAFPGNESFEFERDVLVPLAGLDPEKTEVLDKLLKLQSRITARAAIAQLYLDGEISREEAIQKIRKYVLVSRARAEGGMRFLDEYRSYVLNYSLGEAIVTAHIEGRSGNHEAKWEAFKELLDELPTPSELIGDSR